jgi:hypothetical protein
MKRPNLADYFPFLFPDGDGLAMVITAYFDESERPDAAQPICVGGFAFKPAGYKSFRRYWISNVLRYRGRRVDPFHMTDLCAGQGVYEGLSITDRVAILNHAVHAVKKYAACAQGVFFDQREFVAPPDWPLVFGSIYSVACNLCLQVTSYWMREFSIQSEILYTFEAGHKFEDEADRFLKAIRQSEEARKRFRYRNHQFELKSEVGLQAADLYAWTLTKARSIDGGPIPRAMRPFAEPLLAMVEGSEGRFRCSMFRGDMLDRFLRESLSNPVFIRVDRGPRKPAFR